MPSGGKRAGAGRKRLGISEAQMKRLLKAFSDKARETGQTAADLLAEIAYNKTAYRMTKYVGRGENRHEVESIELEVPVAERRRAIEVFLTLTIAKYSHQTKEVTVTGPVIGLPEIRPKPPEAAFPMPPDPERMN